MNFINKYFLLTNYNYLILYNKIKIQKLGKQEVMRCKTELSDLPGYYIPAHWEASGPPRSPNPAPLPGFTDSPMDEGLSVDPSRYISPVCTGLYRALLASVPVHRTSSPAPSV